MKKKLLNKTADEKTADKKPLKKEIGSAQEEKNKEENKS